MNKTEHAICILKQAVLNAKTSKARFIENCEKDLNYGLRWADQVIYDERQGHHSQRALDILSVADAKEAMVTFRDEMIRGAEFPVRSTSPMSCVIGPVDLQAITSVYKVLVHACKP